MNIVKTSGLIIRSTDYGETTRMVKIYTHDIGIISASLYGAHSKKKGLGGASRDFVWGDLILKESNGRYRVEDMIVKEGFYPLSEDIVKLSLATYMSDLAWSFVGEYNKDESVLKLLLNCIYAMSYNKQDIKKVKTVFELRLGKECGYMPDFEECFLCKTKIGPFYFDAKKAQIQCKDCKLESAHLLSSSALMAIKYIFDVPNEKIFSFNIDENTQEELNMVSEEYITSMAEYIPKSLSYYKKIIK